MTQTMTVQVGVDGVLTLPLGSENANKFVRVTVETVDTATNRTPMSREEWLQFIDETAGAITDPTFTRHPQGEYEQRDKWE
jgi:hypothetical protein